ncbi:hypothetical protein OJF2_02190 [Aquisphaera giovannonii]|uniref:Serine protease n=1 Tax=Aquisphaera giovannonii TaxID=406548 RepID=A0A5B9VUI9_9BACT|nr:serine protease [Aquisphaera giovannonii]QEH31754.1 hypothetical protein OJF2_02190 [Aquisphaera giovannonii]
MAMQILLNEIPILINAIEDGFPSPDLLDPVILALNDSIERHGGLHIRYPTLLLNLVKYYNAKWWIDKLLQALLRPRPDNGRLAEFAWRHGIAFQPPNAIAEVASESAELERMLDPIRGFADFGSLLNRLGAIANAICQISYPVNGATAYGTGFLIGDSTLLTNWHVVELVTTANRKDVELLFDYRTTSAGTTDGGTVHRLVDDDQGWLIDHSPYDPRDVAAEPIAQRLADTRPDYCLDYAVLRTEGSPGAEPASGMTRGFLTLPAGPVNPADLKPDAGLFIIQHPYDPPTQKPLPLQYDWEKPAVRGLNANGTRVVYGVNTRKGSSGSPCFNTKFELVALHHAGAMDWPADAKYIYNQGMPIDRVRKLLADRGKLGEVK